MRLFAITTLLTLSAFTLNADDKGKQNSASKSDGIASYYHDKFEGRQTATGEIFDNDRFTAASNKLKLGTYVKVTNISNGEFVYVRINDRMAKTNTRAIDLASIAAKKLAFHKKGITKVKIEVVTAEEGKLAILSQRDEISTLATRNEM